MGPLGRTLRWLQTMSGDFDVTVLIAPFPRDEVAGWLPPAVELAPQSITAADQHPTYILLGSERNVYFNGWPIYRFRYHEFALVVPFTRWRAADHPYRGPFLYTPLIFVDHPLVSWGGNLMYGFAKTDARFAVDDRRYAVTDLHGNPFAEFHRHETGAAPDAAARATIAAVMQQPSIAYSTRGRYLCSGFDWRLARATITDAAVDGALIERVLPNVPGRRRPLRLEGTAGLSRGGAFRLRTRWVLSPPRSPALDWSPWSAPPPILPA